MHVRKLWERLCESHIYKKKLPPLKGRSKIKEGEYLLSLGKTKEVSQQMSKVDNKKKIWAANMTFGIHDKASDVIRWLRLVIHQRKSWVCIMIYVKRILIVDVNKVICRFLYKDNKINGNDE